MMRGFQIWTHNSNRITSEPLFGKKRSKTAEIVYFHIFDFFGAKKGFRCYPIWILSPDLESSHHLAYLRPHLFVFSHVDFVSLNWNWKISNMYVSVPLNVLKNDFFVHHWIQGAQRHGKPLDLLSISKVRVCLSHPVGTLPQTLLNRHSHTIAGD